MASATSEQSKQMLDAAQEGGYAYPAINITSLTTASGALKAFAEAKSDGIIQVSTGGGQFASGTAVNDAAFGAIVLVAKYDILVDLHTDHCHPEKVDTSRKRIAESKDSLFHSQMVDGSVIHLDENMKISAELLKECVELYTSLGDTMQDFEILNSISRLMFSAIFGYVHGAYKPGSVKIKPTILRDSQIVVTDKYGADAEMGPVSQGGSCIFSDDLQETLYYDIMKMNTDTDTQYAFSRPIVTHLN